MFVISENHNFVVTHIEVRLKVELCSQNKDIFL